MASVTDVGRWLLTDVRLGFQSAAWDGRCAVALCCDDASGLNSGGLGGCCCTHRSRRFHASTCTINASSDPIAALSQRNATTAIISSSAHICTLKTTSAMITMYSLMHPNGASKQPQLLHRPEVWSLLCRGDKRTSNQFTPPAGISLQAVVVMASESTRTMRWRSSLASFLLCPLQRRPEAPLQPSGQCTASCAASGVSRSSTAASITGERSNRPTNRSEGDCIRVECDRRCSRRSYGRRRSSEQGHLERCAADGGWP